MAGGRHIMLAYPLVGPNISRFLRLTASFGEAVFYAVGDDIGQLGLLSSEAVKMGIKANVLIDADVGMHRTGVSMEELEAFYESASALAGIALRGLHCYDGHLHDPDYAARKAKVDEIDAALLKIQGSLVRKGFDCGLMVMGGTPSLPCRTGKENMYLSPGTCFIGDWGYF
jgi:D-serine deaminase-like pyridoxal phosphate-dependent protein